MLSHIAVGYYRGSTENTRFDPKGSQNNKNYLKRSSNDGERCNPKLKNFEIIIIISLLAYRYIWDRLAWYRKAVGYYRTAVGYYRVIAQKILESKSSHQELLKTQNFIGIGPITVENDKNKNRINFGLQK